jgi:hypothetical protein
VSTGKRFLPLPTSGNQLTSHFKRENSNGSKEIKFEKIQFQQEEFRLEKEIQRPQVQQEGQPGSADGNASHAFRQAQSEEPQAGDRDWTFQGAPKRRESSVEEVIQKSRLSREGPSICVSVQEERICVPAGGSNVRH